MIWKYEVPIDDQAHAIAVPLNSRVVHVAMQGFFSLCVWVEFEDGDVIDMDDVTLRVFGTGQPIDDGWEYVGTTIWASDAGQQLVWHLYEAAGGGLDG
jgi:hypothetical protein